MIDLSYSRLNTFERCPWLYHLVYDEGWRAGPSAPAAFGQSLHRTLAAYLAPDNPERTLARLQEFFDQHWVNEGFASPQDAWSAYERGRVMLDRFFALDQNRTATVEATEFDFNVALTEAIRFRGTIDRLDKYSDGTREVVEYKTEAAAWPPERIESDLQMTLYAAGIGQTFPESALRLRYLFLSTGESVEAHRTPDEIATARARLMAVGARLAVADQTPNHASCPRCEFRRRCTKAARP